MSTQIIVRAIFSEPIEPSTLSFVLRNAGGAIVDATATYDPATRTAGLKPRDDLAGSSTFTATISGVRDLAGNQMASAVAWSFTTANPSFQQSTIFSGLTQPTVVEFASDGRVFVAEKSGLIKVFSSLTATSPTVFADMRTQVYNNWDRGLLGMALHPQFPSVPYVYVLYAHDAPIGGTAPVWGTTGATSDPCPNPPGATTDGCVISARLSRLQAAGNVVTGAEEVLIEDWFQQYPSHSIGSLAFGADGALYASGGDGASFNWVDYGQAGNPKNPGGDPPVPVGGIQTPPTAEGGALRSQDLRSPADPVTLDGTIIRIDPDTAAAPADNPLFFSSDPNAKRVIAYGLRNPFRFTIRPGTREVWIGDVGWSTWEEINRVVDATDSVVDNFGWPCYEGNGRQSGYESASLNLCQQLYNEGTGAVVAPFYSYRHGQKVSTENCSTSNGSSISGLAFYLGGSNYPSAYMGALFFSDYSRSCIWVMPTDGAGVPNAAARTPLAIAAVSPAELKIGPGGDLYYVDFNGTIRRIRYFPGNQPPIARVHASPTTGPAPLSVSFSATGSTDPENSALVYAWDLDGDGEFDDSTAAQPTWTYPGGTHTARVRVTDNGSLFDVAAVAILVDETAPNAIIDSPASGVTWKVGDTVTFAGSATDAQDGTLPASSLEWSVSIQHCPDSCHSHPLQSFSGVAAGSFSAPDHEYPSHLEIRLTATDSSGLQGTTVRQLYPTTTAVTFASNPSDLQLVINGSPGRTPFTRTLIVGSSNSISAPSPQGAFLFQGWSDGGAQTHNITAPGSPATYTALYTSYTASPHPVLAFGFNETSGSTAADHSGNGNHGTIAGATHTTQGKFGGALSFDGVDDTVSVAHNASLSLGPAGTIAAWVKLKTVSRRHGVIAKGTASTDAVHNYALSITPSNRAICVLGDGTNSIQVQSATRLSAQRFYHLACAWDGAQLRIYVDGSPEASTNQTFTPAGNGAPLFVGQFGGGANRLDGVIDEVQMYAVAKTQGEIQAILATPLEVDTTPPVRSNGQPNGTLPAGTTQTTLSLATSEGASCRYAATAGVSYTSMLGTFSTTGGTEHSTQATGLTNGTSYTYYVRCRDSAGNSNSDDFSISFAVGSTAGDVTPPLRSNGQPTGTLPAGTTQTTLRLTTSENATCRYATTPSVPYATMANTFGTTGGTAHSSPVAGLADGTSYTYNVRCQDAAGNANPDDFSIAFSVAPMMTPGVHVGDLTGSSTKTGGPNWQATVVIHVVDHNGTPVSGTTVHGAWSNGYSETATCTTGTGGTCSVATTPDLHNRAGSVTYTVNGLSSGDPQLPYAPSANVKTSVAVPRP